MKKNHTSIHVPNFTFHVNKPKAEMLADLFRRGAHKKGYVYNITKKHTPLPDTVGIFYGVVPETYSAFRYYMAEGRAIYLDNGWLSTKEAPTYRFSWNSAQSFLEDMPTSAQIEFPALPKIKRKPQKDLALLILQSRQYFDYLRLGYNRDTWQKVATKILQSKGYRVEVREKPSKKTPEAEGFFDQIARAGIVVSLNSAACLKALRYGIPSYCMLDCTLSPYAPIKLPQAGLAGAPREEEVFTLCQKLASYELPREGLTDGHAFDRFLSVPTDKRRGYWYSAA